MSSPGVWGNSKGGLELLAGRSLGFALRNLGSFQGNSILFCTDDDDDDLLNLTLTVTYLGKRVYADNQAGGRL